MFGARQWWSFLNGLGSWPGRGLGRKAENNFKRMGAAISICFSMRADTTFSRRPTPDFFHLTPGQILP